MKVCFRALCDGDPKKRRNRKKLKIGLYESIFGVFCKVTFGDIQAEYYEEHIEYCTSDTDGNILEYWTDNYNKNMKSKEISKR